MTLNDKTAVKIKELRTSKNILQSQFAKDISMSPSAYSRLENGEVQITLNSLEEIAQKLESSIMELLDIKPTQISNFNNNQLCPIHNGTLNITLTPEEFNKVYESISKKKL